MFKITRILCALFLGLVFVLPMTFSLYADETMPNSTDDEPSKPMLDYSIDELYMADQHAIAVAAAEGNLIRIEELIQNGVDVNGRSKFGVTPLYAGLNNIDGFQALLKAGADPNIEYFDDMSTMKLIVFLNRGFEFLKLAIDHGGDVNKAGRPFNNSLIFYTLDQPESFQLLLEKGANINYQEGNSGESLLMAAASSGYYDIVLDLLELGADFTIVDKAGYSLANLVTSHYEGEAGKLSDKQDSNMRRAVEFLRTRGVKIPADAPPKLSDEQAKELLEQMLGISE